MIEGEVVKVPAQFFTVSKSLKELTEGHGSNKKVTLPSVKRAIWNLLERKIEDICADIVTVEYLKSINEKRFIESYCFRALKKKYCDHYTQYTSEEIAGLLSLCHYLDIPFLIDVFTDIYKSVWCAEIEKRVHKDHKAAVLKEMDLYFEKLRWKKCDRVECSKLRIDFEANREAMRNAKWTPLHSAARDGQVDCLKALLDGADIEAKDGDRETPLWAAMRAGTIECVKVLLEAGADTEAQNMKGLSPLHVATELAQVDCLEALLNNGADIEAKAWSGRRTPLHVAAGKGNVECLKVLIKMGAEIKAKDSTGETPLHHAARNGRVECLKVLIEMGADIEAKDNDGRTPFYFAAEEGRVGCLEVLLDSGANREAKSKKECTALHAAAEYGNGECLKVLINSGAGLNAKTKRGWTPLHYAAWHGNGWHLHILVEAGADVENKNENGETPLHFAAKKGRIDCLNTLVRQGANIKAETKDGWTPLHSAASNGNADCLKTLLEVGADVEAQDSDGKTPLHGAAEYGKVECLKALIDAGANIDAEDKNGKTAFTIAKDETRWKVLVALKEYQDRQNEAEAEKDGSLVIEGKVFKVPGKLFKVSKSLKELTEGHGSNKKVTLPSVKRAIWDLFYKKIESICADSGKVEYLKSIDEKEFIKSAYYRNLKKKHRSYYAGYTSEEIAGLLNLCNYLNIPFWIDIFTDIYPKACFAEIEKRIHKDLKANIIKAISVYLSGQVKKSKNKRFY